MKQIRLLLPLLFAVLTLSVFGQTPIDFDKIDVKDPNAPFFDEPQDYRTLGVDVGLSYQTSDVRPVWGGWGIGVTYEKNMVHQKGGAFDLGIRGRLMYANSRGYDNRATVGVRDNPLPQYKGDSIYFANFLTHQGELAVEGVLTFNQLREKQGIYATLFGGLGIVGYDVRVDQLDANGNKYNYKSLGATPTVSEVRSFHDGNFETSRLGGDTLTGVGFMPSIGAEIGFQVSPKFMIVLGHKWTFTQTDLFDGKEFINKVDKGTRNDFHQYTHIGLKWILGAPKPKRENPRQENPTYPNPTYPTPTNPTPTNPTPREKLPIVRFTAPNAYLETTRERLPIIVKIDNVYDYPSVFLVINGRESRDFAFRNGELTSEILLQEGNNSVTVSAKNSAGSSSDNVNINFRREGTQTNPTNPTPTVSVPRVQITSTGTPTSDNFGGCQTNLEARIDNISSRNEISLTVNGRAVSNFSFDNNTKILRGPLSLGTGTSQIVVSARNSAGVGSDQRSVTCAEKPRVSAPTVRINKPSNGQNFDVNPVEIRATVQNISNRNQVEMYLNGSQITDFVYYNFDKSVTARVNLIAGENQIRIKATNDGGSAEDATRFNLSERPRTNAPVVQILRPSNNSRVSETTANMEAKVDNVTDKNGIQVIVNGVSDLGFTFDIYTHIVRTRVNIQSGQNTITVRAQNETGNAEATVRVMKRGGIEPPPPPPPADKEPPVVSISSPANGSRTTETTVNLTATAQNTEQSQVKVYLNGAELSFRMSGNQIQAMSNLVIGQNTFVVKATNKDGTDEKSVNITRDKVKQLPEPGDKTTGDLPTNDGGLEQPEQAPTIANFNATQPVIDPFDPKPALSVITATVGNVKNAGQIEVYINGAQQTNFTFDVATQQLRLTFEPKGGVSYTFNIVAKNSTGRTTKREVVKF
jgi:Bacterial Ig domain